MNISEQILTEAYALIERGWVQGWDARNRYGKMVQALTPDACAWCLTGALTKAATHLHLREEDRQRAYELVAAALPTGESRFVVVFNDSPGRTKEQVLAVLDDAIELAKQA